MASSSKGKGSVRTVQWWKHLRDWKRPQNKRVRQDGKNLLENFEAEEMQDPADADAAHWEDKAAEKGLDDQEL